MTTASGPGITGSPPDIPGESADNAVAAGDAAPSVVDGDPATPRAAPAPVTLADWLLVALITLLTAWTAVVGMAFLPLHIGSLPFPISALLGVAAMVLAPRACYRLTGSLIAALLPVAAWFAVSVWLVLARNSLLGGLPVTVINGQWRVMVLLGLGSLAAAATLGLIWGDRLRDRLTAQQAAAQARDDDWIPDPANGRG
jgi:hypothetical protein